MFLILIKKLRRSARPSEPIDGLHPRLAFHLNFDEMEPLLDQMMECVTIIPDPKVQAITRPLIEDDIEDVATRVMLRTEVFQLHVDFSLAGLFLKIIPAPLPISLLIFLWHLGHLSSGLSVIFWNISNSLLQFVHSYS